jgi:phage-related protein
MKTLAADLMQDLLDLQQESPWLVLLDFHLHHGRHIRLVDNTENITYGGNEYIGAPLEAVVARLGKNTRMPRYGLRLSNLDRIFSGPCQRPGGLEGQDLVVTLVNTSNLAADYSDFETTYTILGHDDGAEYISFELGGPNLYLAGFPRRRYLATLCEVNFKGALCAYALGESSCNHTLARCRELNNATRFGGSPGLRPQTLRVIV